jgi:DNA-binding transcriptional regulator YiaG
LPKGAPKLPERSLSAVRDWEQHRKVPEPATRAFLKVIEKELEAVERALSAA